MLWEVGVDEAERRFGRVLVHRGIEAEASLSYAGLSDLLAPVIDSLAGSLPPPRRRALEIALWLADPGEQPPEQGAIGLAVLDVLRTLAAEETVVIALDDLQWLDAASAAVLQIALRRLREERIGLLATLRSGPDITAPVELERAFREERLELLPVGPLSLAALHDVLQERLGLELTRPELVRLADATAGNPFFALELGRELVRTNTRLTPGRALPVPEALHELLGGRLARLPSETVDVLLQAAALARPTVDLVADAHGDRQRVADALETAVREGVVALDGSSVRFAHPLMASICYEQAPVWKRRAVHQALAEVVTGKEERARHLALAASGPDERIASELDGAAEQAAARGAPAAAAELYELAAKLTAGDPALVRQRRRRAATSYRLAGDGERAAAMLHELLPEVPSGVERAHILYQLVETLRGDPRTLLRLCDEALDQAAGDDVRCARILGHRMGMHLWDADVRAALVDARAALEMAERVSDPALLAEAIARVASAETYAADVTPGLLERGVAIEDELELALEYYQSPRYARARLRARLGEIDWPRSVFEELEARAAARGDEGTRMMALWPLAMLEWLVGRWPRALEHAAAAAELSAQTQHSHALMWVARVKALLEADLGLVGEARASAEESLRTRERPRMSAHGRFPGGVRPARARPRNLEAAGDYLRGSPAVSRRGRERSHASALGGRGRTLVSLGGARPGGLVLGDTGRTRADWAAVGAGRGPALRRPAGHGGRRCGSPRSAPSTVPWPS